ncbi:Protein of unknown function [Lacrimispora sphenoides]|jgi:uncharacterized membrane protein|uniref:DUF975 family protein n=1 Tax=Lacrimispora sphenoides TaxID=29370 RepID=UPI0008CAD18B|nr:DUF975 family protein [Lacrimispora sphenoides]SEU29612.1 Protein of unknown function [Lacrimispora sphenoides]
MSRKALKFDAKDAMRDALVSPIIVTLIMGVIMVILSAVQGFLDIWQKMIDNAGAYDLGQTGAFAVSSIIFLVINIVVSTIIQFGYQSYCLKVANRDDTMSYGDLFGSVRYLLKALGLILMVSLLTFLWTLLLIIPGIIAAYRYSQAVIIMVEDPSKGIMQCIRESKEMMVGHKWEFFVLELSFILWQLLGLVTCGIAFIYVYPYMKVTFTNFYNAIKPNTVVFEEATVIE